MKKYLSSVITLLLLVWVVQGCDSTVTYADMLETEQENIQKFIQKEKIKVISEAEFIAKGKVTDVEKNEYVLFSNNVYMQIVEHAEGEYIAKTNDQILVRFKELDLASDKVISNFATSLNVDEFRYVLSDTKASAQFINTYGGMYQTYGSAVPAGWLVPMEFLYLGRSVTKRAHVKLIVPGTMGHTLASRYVLAKHYELYFQLSH